MRSVTVQAPARSFAFDRWLLQSDGTLMRDNIGINLPPKELSVLRLLLESAGKVISKDHLLSSVWPETDAAEESLTRCIYALRKLLKESKGFIATIYGQGYRFTCPVVMLEAPGSTPALAPALAVLPFRGVEESEALDLQDEMIRQLTTACGEALRVIPSGLMAHRATIDVQRLIGQLAADYYLSGRCVRHAGRQQWSVELIRASDHALIRGQTLDVNDLGKALQELTCLVVQRTPGLRPVGNSCSSYPAAVAYLSGLCSVREHTVESLRNALVQFRHCLQLADDYALAWCGVVDAWLGLAMLDPSQHEHAIAQAHSATSRAVALDPGSPQVLARLALLTSLRGCEDAADVLFRRCLLSVDQADVHYYHAWHHWFWRRNKQAAQSLEQCLLDDPDCVRAKLLQARITHGAGTRSGAQTVRQTLQCNGKLLTFDHHRCRV
jgi:DNA-binding winged helix-turn-helix (wHTH) protein